MIQIFVTKSHDRDRISLNVGHRFDRDFVTIEI